MDYNDDLGLTTLFSDAPVVHVYAQPKGPQRERRAR